MKRYMTEKGWVVEYGNTKLLIRFAGSHYARNEYEVELTEGEWPSDSDLFTICDGGTPPNSCHFGGRLSKNGSKAVVSVYTD